jgi:hypothetical protein
LPFLILVLLFLSACPLPDPIPTQDSPVEPDETNYSSDYSVRVRNNSSERLVAFKGDPALSTLIGGVPSSATNHGLKRDPVLFTESCDFIMSIITRDNYDTYYDSLDSSPLFTQIYVHYNQSGIDSVAYDISGRLGGNATVVIQNSVSMNVELRLDGINGIPLGYVASNHYNTTLYVATGDYLLFPVFRQYSNVLDEIVTVYPKTMAGTARFFSFALANPGDEQQCIIDLNYLNDVDLDVPFAYVVIQNDASVGIWFYDGSNRLATPSNTYTINSGTSSVFEIPMTIADNIVSPSITKSTLKVLVASIEADIEEYTFNGGYSYNIRITGSDAGLTAESPTIVGEVDLDTLFE